MTDDKNGNSNLLFYGLGIITIFFGYLIYMKSKETLPTTLPTTQPTIQPTTQPIQIPQSPQLQDSLYLYQISEQLKLQNDQIQQIQTQQLQQMQNIAQIESTKCSNVVSMNDNDNDNQFKLLKPHNLSNVRRENEEEIANRIFGMK